FIIHFIMMYLSENYDRLAVLRSEKPCFFNKGNTVKECTIYSFNGYEKMNEGNELELSKKI
ncbi:hypothetical protein PVA17_11075, partial [Lysinibacillus sp. CNPSo 3705]|uniref:hypothetical protein n=1 Tax=Lysinibacillus sp. CNPSo 3705 TaxID=3028148 RepID=UPI0023649330